MWDPFPKGHKLWRLVIGSASPKGIWPLETSSCAPILSGLFAGGQLTQHRRYRPINPESDNRLVRQNNLKNKFLVVWAPYTVSRAAGAGENCGNGPPWAPINWIGKSENTWEVIPAGQELTASPFGPRFFLWRGAGHGAV